jgi:hypothetical protein
VEPVQADLLGRRADRREPRLLQPNQTSPVQVNGIGVELISNGILLQELPVQTGDFPGAIAPGIEQPESVTFGGAVSATSCQAGWQ